MTTFYQQHATNKSMLSGDGLEKSFWAELVASIFYLINMLPTLNLVDKKPIEAWLGNTP